MCQLRMILRAIGQSNEPRLRSRRHGVDRQSRIENDWWPVAPGLNLIYTDIRLPSIRPPIPRFRARKFRTKFYAAPSTSLHFSSSSFHYLAKIWRSPIFPSARSEIRAILFRALYTCHLQVKLRYSQPAFLKSLNSFQLNFQTRENPSDSPSISFLLANKVRSLKWLRLRENTFILQFRNLIISKGLEFCHEAHPSRSNSSTSPLSLIARPRSPRLETFYIEQDERVTRLHPRGSSCRIHLRREVA